MQHLNTIVLQAFAEEIQALPETGTFMLMPTFPLGDHDMTRQLDLVRTGAIRLGKSINQREQGNRPDSLILDRAQEVVVTIGYPAQTMQDVLDFQDVVVAPLETAIAESKLLAQISRMWFLAGSRPLIRENIVSAIVVELTWIVNLKTPANRPGIAIG